MNRVVTITVSMMNTVSKKKTKKITQSWTEEERLLFTHQRLRAQTIPNKKRVKSKQAARGRRRFYLLRGE